MEVTEIASKLGKEQKFIISPEGFRSRYTDRETAEIYMMVMAGKDQQANCPCTSESECAGIWFIGLGRSASEGRTKKASIIVIDERGRKKVIDGGYTGKISSVSTSLIELLLEKGFVPVVTPIAVSEEFEPLNVDGDRTAAFIAGALKADRLILLTDVQGLVLRGKPIEKISSSDVKGALGTIGQGMSTKVHAALEALNQGVGEVIVTSGSGAKPVSSALKHECGTVISRE